MTEMRQLPHLDTFYTRGRDIKSHLNIVPILTPLIENCLKVKLGDDQQDHNKLRFYKQLKGSFKVEPYIENICKRR